MNSCCYLIQNSLSNCSPSERRIAEFILEKPQESMMLGISELAEQAGSSTAAIIRLCKRIKVDGFRELKILLAKDVYSTPIVQEYPEFTFLPNESIEDITHKIISAHRQNLDNMLKTVNPKVIEITVTKILSARYICIVGIGASGIAALDLHQKLVRVGLLSFFNADSHMQLTAAATLTEKDVCIIFSYSGETEEALTAADSAKKSGVPTFAVTRIGINSLSKICDYSLFIPDTESIVRHGAFLSRLNQLMVIDIIYTALISSDIINSFENIDKTRKAVKS